MKRHTLSTHFMICVDNEGYEASLELRKVYRIKADARAREQDLVRVVDESGEVYLYPLDRFVAIKLPKAAERSFVAAA